MFAKILGGIPYRLSFNKYYIDELYDYFIVNPVKAISKVFLWGNVDVKIIDGSVNGIASLTSRFSGLLGRLQTGLVSGYAFSVALGMLAILSYLALK